jgi:hypothetical protein
VQRGQHAARGKFEHRPLSHERPIRSTGRCRAVKHSTGILGQPRNRVVPIGAIPTAAHAEVVKRRQRPAGCDVERSPAEIGATVGPGEFASCIEIPSNP